MEKITIKELEQLFSLLILHFKTLKVQEINLEDKWYWKVDETEKFIFDKTPSLLNVGSFSDDIERIKKILIDKDITLTDLSTLSNILNCIENTILS